MPPIVRRRRFHRCMAHQLVRANPWSRENVMRDALERMFGKPFPTVRPRFLRNPASGWPLELDAYNADLKLAAEFNGIQHRVYPNPYHTNRRDFQAQQQRDQLKVELCELHGVKLVVVPDTVCRDDIEEYLKLQLIPFVAEVGEAGFTSSLHEAVPNNK